MAAVAGATLLATLLQGIEATGSQAKTPTGSRTATISLDGLSPRMPTHDDSVTVTGTVVNGGRSTITDAHMGVRIGPDGPVRTRAAMTNAQNRVGFTTAGDGTEVAGHTAALPDIPAGGSAAFSLKVPVSALGLGTTGVYQLGVTIEGQDAAESWNHVLGIKRTFLPWYSDGESARPTQMTYLWPLTDRPHIAARGDTDSVQHPIFLDDDLAKELGPGGRLSEMVELAKQLPVTWVVDPDLLASVETMLKDYRVAGPGGDVTRTTPGTGSAVARQWLNELRTAVAGDQVVALPFGDTDLASLAHRGASAPGTAGHLKDAAALGASTVNTILGVHASSNVGWPVDGAIDRSIVSVARTGGLNQMIARSDTFPENNDLPYTPTAARPIGGGTTAVVADAALSTAFTGDMLRTQNANLAVQSFIAQTLLITMQAPQNQRTLVVAPQRIPTVSQAAAMAEAIGAVDAAPWAQSVDLSAAAAARPDAHASRQVPSVGDYPAALRKGELSADAFRQIQETQSRLNDFVVILTVKDRVTVPFGNAVLRSLSTQWRGDPRGAADFRDSIGGYLQDLINAVHILDKTTLTLSGRSGTIPITVKNDLGQPVTGLALRLTSGTNIRLAINNPDQPIAIDGGHTRTLKFQTKANANGTVRITAHLYTQDGHLYGNSVRFDVKITKVTDLVMLIIAAGLLLLVLAGVRIYRQRKRHAAQAGGEDEAASAETDGASGADGRADSGADDITGGRVDSISDSGADGISDSDTDSAQDGHDGPDDHGGPAGDGATRQAGDPAADTGRNVPDPSPADEKVDG